MRVVAVTVNWNQAALTARCVRSLMRGSVVPDAIVVVDNGSQEDPAMALAEIDGGLELIRNEENLGFAGGANRGIERALELGADVVFVINNDATAECSCVAALVDALGEQPRLAAVGAKTLTEEQPPRIHTAYGVLTYNGPLVQQRGWMEPDVTLFNDQCDVDYISGCAILLRASVLREVGLFDESFFAYHEDLDWCARVRAQGYRVSYVPRAVVYHRMHASTGGGYGSAITYLSSRNSILFVRKNATWREWLRFYLHLGPSLVREAAFRLPRGEGRAFLVRLRGVRDGLLRRPVPLARLGLHRLSHHHRRQDASRPQEVGG